MKPDEVDSAKELLRIKPRPKDVVVKIQILSAKASMKDDRTGVLIISLMLTEIERDPESFKDAWGIELFKPKKDGLNTYRRGGLVKQMNALELNEGGEVIEDYIPREDTKRIVPTAGKKIKGRGLMSLFKKDHVAEDVYGAEVVGDDEFKGKYRREIENVAGSFGLTPQSIHFNLEHSVGQNYDDRYGKGGGEVASTSYYAHDTEHPLGSQVLYNIDHSSEVSSDALAAYKYADTTSHEWAHRFNQHLADMDETGGTKKGGTNDLPPGTLSGYGFELAGDDYLKDYYILSTREERRDFFNDKAMSAKSKMRKPLKKKVASAMSHILSDPLIHQDIESKSNVENVNYVAHPGEIWARALAEYHIIKKHGDIKHVIEEDNASVLYIDHPTSKREGSMQKMSLTKETYDAIEEMLKEIKQEKFTISRNIPTQLTALTLNA